MSLKKCMDKARKANLINEDDISDLYSRVKPFQNRLEISLGPEASRVRAEINAISSKIAQLRRKKYRRALQINRTRINVSDVRSHPEGIRRGVMSKQTKDVEAHLGGSPWSNVDNRAQAILGWLHSQWSEALSGLRTRNLGFTQNRERLLNSNVISNEADILRAVNGLETPGLLAAMKTGNPITMAKASLNAMGNAYKYGDEIWKMGQFVKGRETGLQPSKAIEAGNKYQFDYSDIPVGIKAVRDFYIPFFTYTYKALPVIAEAAVKNPHRYLGMVATLSAINMASYAYLYGGDAEKEEKLEREIMPDYMKGATLFSNRAMRLPYNKTNEYGGEIATFLDMSRIMPGGNVFDIRASGDGAGWLDILGGSPFGNHPLMNITTGLFVTGENYFNKNIYPYPEEDKFTNPDNVKAAVKFIASNIIPNTPGIPGSWSTHKLGNALVASDKIRNVLGDKAGDKFAWVADKAGWTGMDYAGRIMDPKQAAASTVGIKVRDVDIDASTARKHRKLKYLESDAKRTRTKTMRDHRVTESQKEKAKERFEKRRQELKRRHEELRKLSSHRH